MKPIRTFIHQNGIKLVLNAEKPIYNLTKGKLAKNRFLSSVNVDYIGTNVKIVKIIVMVLVHLVVLMREAVKQEDIYLLNRNLHIQNILVKISDLFIV